MTAAAPARAASPLRFLTLLVNGLALTMESAPVLEWPQKWQYDAAFYARVNGTLYRYFAIVGGHYSTSRRETDDKIQPPGNLADTLRQRALR